MAPSIIQDIQSFDGALREIATIDARVAKFDVDRQQEVLIAEGRYSARTETLLGRRAILAKQLEAYYREHRAEMERGKKRSVELQYGSVGIKLSAWSLKLRKGWTWEKVLNAIKDRDLPYVRTKESVDKPALKGAKLPASELDAIGVKLGQTEKFWFETKPLSAAKKGEAAA